MSSLPKTNFQAGQWEEFNTLPLIAEKTALVNGGLFIFKL
jgi:hypothetical protein